MKINAAFATFFLALAALAAGLDAAAQTPKVIRVNASSDTVSSMSEIPAGDYLIAGSQIYVGGRGGASRWLSLIGVAIDNGRNETAAAGAADKLQIKFDALLMPALAALEGRNAIPEARFVSSDGPYEAKLLPSARFIVQDDGNAAVTFRLTARLRLDPSTSEVTKGYFYPIAFLRPLGGVGGWIENDAALVRIAAQAAFERLVEAFAYDAAGRFTQAREPAMQRLVTLRAAPGATPQKAVLLIEMPDAVATMPIIGERQYPRSVNVFDRLFIDQDVPIESAKQPGK